MGIFNVSSFATNDLSRNMRENQTQTTKENTGKANIPVLFRFGGAYTGNGLAQDMKERREEKEKQDAKLRDSNTQYLKKIASPITGELNSLSDLLAAKSKIEQFKYYRNCTEKYDTSEIDEMLYAFQKQENKINQKIENINNGKEDENASMQLYGNLKRDFYA